MVTIIIKFIKKILGKSRAKITKNLQNTDSKVKHARYIIPRAEHNLSKTDVHVNALQILNKLNNAGFESYLVGGSVRDLLLGKVPKDFDITTNATPQQIKKLFRNARIIGRRFKLVHVIFYRNIIEVATFRSHPGHDKINADNGMLIQDNAYGEVDEDALRRDFTANALYYNIQDSTIIDFTGGVQDIKQQILKIIGDPNVRYQEDPVRMLRTIRFGAQLNFKFADNIIVSLPKMSYLITQVPSLRLLDEVIKIYHCGAAQKAQQLLIKYNLFSFLFPQTANILDETNYATAKFIESTLKNTDIRIKESNPVNPAFILAVLLWFPLQKQTALFISENNWAPLLALEQAMNKVIDEQNKITAIPKRLSQTMREIWLLQYRFARRFGARPFRLLQHPRFRAAYDFLILRNLANANKDLELVNWWTKFQESSPEERTKMVNAITTKQLRKFNKKTKKHE